MKNFLMVSCAVLFSASGGLNDGMAMNVKDSSVCQFVVDVTLEGNAYLFSNWIGETIYADAEVINVKSTKNFPGYKSIPIASCEISRWRPYGRTTDDFSMACDWNKGTIKPGSFEVMKNELSHCLEVKPNESSETSVQYKPKKVNYEFRWKWNVSTANSARIIIEMLDVPRK